MIILMTLYRAVYLFYYSGSVQFQIFNLHEKLLHQVLKQHSFQAHQKKTNGFSNAQLYIKLFIKLMIYPTFSSPVRIPLRKGKRGGILLRRKYPLRIPPFSPSLKGVHVAKGWGKNRLYQKLAFHKFIQVLLTFLKRAQTREVRKNWGSMVQGPGVSKSKKCFSVVIWDCH